jgi:hypothetical protein
MSSTANFFPKMYGYTPDPKKEIDGNRLDKYNPHEFRTGMDYELTAMGCMRLAESTPEERQKATESVLKNLEEHNGYYTALITYESLYKNPAEGVTKPSFKAWLKEQDDNKFKEVKNAFKQGKMKDADFKNDKTKEIKLKEAIKKEIQLVLLEKKGEEDEGEKEPKAKDLKAIEKEMGRFEAEIFALEKLLFNGKDGDREDEYTADNPAEGTFLFIKKQLFDDYKEQGWTGDEYREKSEEALKTFEKQLEDHVKEFGAEGKGNNVALKDLLKGPTKRADGKTQTGFNATINALEQRVKAIENEKGEEATQIRNEKMEVAYQDMTREQHIKLLEIIREHGISLREGAMGVKTYYEIAKAAYLEGLTNGLRL